MSKPSTKPEDIDLLLKDKMAEIEALVEAIAAEEPDCDLKFADLLSGEPEAMRISIIEKLRQLLKAKSDEKEMELNAFIEAEKRLKIERQRSLFRQWLQWMIAEEKLERMREAFLAVPLMERLVRNVGRDMNVRGMKDIQVSDKNQLGELSNNAPLVSDFKRQRGDKGRN